jgi:hypothetical protein
VSSGPFEASSCQSLAFFRRHGSTSVTKSYLLYPLSGSGSRPDRPTGRRLLLAMALASTLLATVLLLDVNLDQDIRGLPTADEISLDVYITSRKTHQPWEPATGEQEVRLPDEQLQAKPIPGKVSAKQEESPNDSPGSPIEPQPGRDWHARMEHSAQATVDKYIRQEDVRASMWQQTRSVMFRPQRNSRAVEEEPLLTNIRFREPVGVFGLGITIGSCFIGIPIAGVPVEQRSTAITLFVCRDDSG